MSLPGVHDGIKWEHDLCYMVAEKMFCVTGLEEGAAVSLKVGDDEFEELCERDGISPAPYLARNKWVIIEKRSALKPKEWEYYIRQSYELIKSKLPKKVREALG